MQTRTKLFLTLFITYAFFTNTYLTTNDASRFSLTAAIVERRTLEIGDFLEEAISEWWWAKDFAVYEGRVYSDKAPLGSFLGVPVYSAVRFFTADLGIIIYFVTLLTSGLLTAATAVMIYDIGRYFTDKKRTWLFLSATYGLGSAAFFYGTVFFSHAITAFFGFASFYLLFVSRREGGETKPFLLSGALAALAVSSDYYAGITAIALFGYAAVSGRKAYLFLASFLVTLVPLLMYHWAAFKDPFVAPYLYANLYTEYHSTGFYGIRILDGLFISNFISQLFDKWGFFFTMPLALLTLASFKGFWERYREEAAFILITTAGFFYVTGSIGRFDAYTSRLLMPIVPFLFLPLYTLNYDTGRVRLAAGLLLFVSLVINLAGVDTFLPQVADPSVIRATFGNHNILGEFLLKRGVNLHHLTILPLFIIYAFIWREEIFKASKGKD